jgi:hypothetical protein
MTNTTWSSTDKLNCTLGGTNNLTVSGVTNAGGARTLDGLASGKFYFEYTCTTWTTNCGVGVANGLAVLSSVASQPVNAAFVQGASGNIWVNNANTGVTLGARANGDIIGVALDLTNNLIWFRASPSGNWNGNAGYAPGGTGGISIAAIKTYSPMFGLFCVNNNAAQTITANFGDTAFSGAVPAGFTSGFTAGLGGGTRTIASTVTLEEWGQVPFVPGGARASTVTLEEWSSIAFVPGGAVLSTITLEQWGSVAIVSVSIPQAHVQVMT